MRRLAWILLVGLLPAKAIGETNAAAVATQAAEMLQAAAQSLAEADGTRDRVEALTETVRAYEEGLRALREGVRQASVREGSILASFEAERDRLSRLLGVLQSIQSAPGPLLLLHPDGPVGTARAGMIVSDVTPALAREARTLQDQLEELQRLRAIQETALTRLSDGLSGVQSARAALSQAIADRRDLPPPFAMDADAMQAILEGAVSLDAVAEALAAQPSAAPSDMPDFARAIGRLEAPVIGTILRRYGETDAAGVSRPGLVLATRPRALATTPWPATVRYAGPLLDYGNVIILEPESDYLLIVAGLGEVLVQVGELLQGGAPLGLMPGPTGAGDDLILRTFDEGGSILSETLYLELRERGQTVDPTEWFALE